MKHNFFGHYGMCHLEWPLSQVWKPAQMPVEVNDIGYFESCHIEWVRGADTWHCEWGVDNWVVTTQLNATTFDSSAL